MQTTRVIYLVIWGMFLIPLLALGIRHMFIRRIGEKTRIKTGVVIITAAVAIGLSVFLYAAYETTLTSRYELAAERYIELHAHYVLGIRDDVSYQKEVNLLRSADGDQDSFAAFDEQLRKDVTASDKIRFQISSWITPKYYKDDPAFPETAIIKDDNPVFIVYLFEEETEQTYYMLRMEQQESGWKITYQGLASEEQIQAAQSALPSQKNGQWFTITK